MIHIISSTAAKKSAGLVEVKRKATENNLAWLQRNLPSPSGTFLLMVGGRSQVAFRLRTAQAYLRHDLLPSYWSDSMLLGKAAKNIANTPVHEISLEPPAGFGFPTPTNAVQTGKLAQYRDAERYPNICILNVPVELGDVLEALKRFQMQRAVLDAVDLLIRWMAYAWGVTHTANPLVENHGVPSAAMLEVVFGAVGFDLTPGLESRASCPEAIWQAAKWWSDYYEQQNRKPLTGAYYCGHNL
jgi:hypothetical protein